VVRQARVRNADHNPEPERSGDVVGHESIGEVVEVGRGVEKVKKGGRVVVPSFVGCFTIPDGLPDEQVLFLSDAAPTGYRGADFCGIQPGTPSPRAVPGCGSPRWKSAAGAQHALSCTGSAWVPGIGHDGARQPGVAMGSLDDRRGPRGRDPRGPA
jgi:hypothetical protein